MAANQGFISSGRDTWDTMQGVSNFWHGSVKLSLDSISLTISSRLEYLFLCLTDDKTQKAFSKGGLKNFTGKSLISLPYQQYSFFKFPIWLNG